MRKLLAAATLVLAMAGVAAPAAAGGWAVTTLDPLAAAPVAGEPFEVGFTILQHGRTPFASEMASIVVTGPSGGTTRFEARPAGAAGHHVATVEISATGTVTWAVEHEFGRQELGGLTVGPGAAAASTAGDGSPWTAPIFVVAAVLAGLGLVDLGRSRRVRPVATA